MKPLGSRLLGWIVAGVLAVCVLGSPAPTRADLGGPPAGSAVGPVAMPRPAWDRQGSQESYGWLVWVAVPVVIGIGGIVVVVVMGRKGRRRDSTPEG